MNESHYILKINAFMQRHENFKKLIIFFDKFMPKPVVFLFYSTIAILMFKLDIRFFPVAIIPWITFLLVTLLRNRLNLKRPFEEYNFEPLAPHSKGKACPSRHASSSAVIAFAVYYVYPLAGIILGVSCIIICITRVLTGVHFLRDVVWGALIGAFCGYLGFFVIL